MEKYTELDNPVVEKKIEDVIRLMRNEIIMRFHPKAIILNGSFGKGEVTLIEDSRGLRFLSDCEVIIIPYKYIFNRSKVDEFESNFDERTGLKVGVSGVKLSIYSLFHFLNRKLKPTIANYDLKWGSKVIYGKNYLGRIPDVKPEEIPLWEGIKLLLNRMAEALEYFSFKNHNEEMVFWTDKIILACQDALLLSLGEYHYSYRKKNEMFQNLFPENFEELKEELQNFLDLTIEATERKLNGTRNVDDPIGYWFDTAKICDKVFRYVIKKDMDMEFGDYMEFQEKYLRHQKIRSYSSGFFSLPICQNLRSAAKMWVFGHKLPTVKLMQKIMIPWRHVVYSMIPAVYFGLSRSSEVNYNMLEKIENNLTLLKASSDYGQNNVKLEGKYIKKQILAAWRVICY